MAIVERVEKRELIITLGAHEAPASYRWSAKRFLTNDEDGSDAAPPQTVSVPATAEEVAAHISEAMVKLLADIAADGERYQALQAELQTERRARQALEAQAAAPAE